MPHVLIGHGLTNATDNQDVKDQIEKIHELKRELAERVRAIKSSPRLSGRGKLDEAHDATEAAIAQFTQFTNGKIGAVEKRLQRERVALGDLTAVKLPAFAELGTTDRVWFEMRWAEIRSLLVTAAEAYRTRPEAGFILGSDKLPTDISSVVRELIRAADAREETTLLAVQMAPEAWRRIHGVSQDWFREAIRRLRVAQSPSPAKRIAVDESVIETLRANLGVGIDMLRAAGSSA